MTASAGRRIDRLTWLAAAASAAVVVVSNVSGLAVSDDGVAYLAVADRVTAGHGFGYFLEPRLTTWPPLWPLAISLTHRITGLDGHDAAAGLNAVTAAALVVVATMLAQRVVRDARLVRLVTLTTAVGASSVLFGHLLTSDFVTALVTTAALVVLIDHHRRPRWSLVIGAAALCAVAFALRYAALAYVPVVLVWLALDRRRPWQRRLAEIAAFAGVALVFPALWMLRNHGIDGSVLGPRYSSARGVLGNTFDAVSTVGNFLAPGVAFETRTIWVGVALVGVAVMAVLSWRVARRDDRARSVGGVVDAVAGGVGLLVLHVVGHTAYLIAARSTTAFDRLSFRLLNPVYLPLVVLGFVIVDRVLTFDDGSWPRLARGVALVWSGFTVVLGLGMAAYFATGPALFDGNYERDAFVTMRSSPLLRRLPTDCTLESNLPDALYEAGIEARWSPRLTEQQSDEPLGELDAFGRTVERRDVCLVWIDLEPRFPHVAPLADLRRRAVLTEVEQDGVITVYRATART